VWVDGKSVETSAELYEIIQTKGLEPLDFKVVRDGKTVTLEDVRFSIMERSNGERVVLIDFNVDQNKNVVTMFYKTVYEVSSADSGLEKGDKVIKVDGKRVRNLDELSYEIMRKGYEPIDITVIRNGEEKTIENVVFPVSEEQGQRFGMLDFQVLRIEKNFFKVIGYSLSKSFLIVRMCWESIIDLITGRYTLAAVSGPVGISQAIGSAANEGFLSLLSIVGLISMNLGVMNLLPLPALDGGRLGMILAEMITRKKIPAKIEATINAVGLVVLLGLSAVIMVKDIFGLFK
jgi:regulator of sigma E protease